MSKLLGKQNVFDTYHIHCEECAGERGFNEHFSLHLWISLHFLTATLTFLTARNFPNCYIHFPNHYLLFLFLSLLTQHVSLASYSSS